MHNKIGETNEKFKNMVHVNPKTLKFINKAWQQRYLLLMSVPLMIWVIIFQYLPIWGWSMAFQNYKLGKSFSEQEWAGLKYFIELWSDQRFWLSFRNTLAMSMMGMVASFTLPIIFALFLNEIRKVYFKRSIQTVSYLPHFVSWVVVSSMFIKILSTDGGIINDILISLNIVEQPVHFMAQPKLFWWIVTIVSAWKGTGWQSIIYIAAISGIDPQLYEAATVDGCGRYKKMWHITLPGISSTIVILFIMAVGNLARFGFEAPMLLGNPIVQDYSEVIDLYALRYGIGAGRYSYGTAIGVFNSLVAIILLVTANSISKKARGESVF